MFRFLRRKPAPRPVREADPRLVEAIRRELGASEGYWNTGYQPRREPVFACSVCGEPGAGTCQRFNCPREYLPSGLHEPTATAAPMPSLRESVNAPRGPVLVDRIAGAKAGNVATFTEHSITEQPEHHPVRYRP